MANFCSNCGSKLRQDDNFCSNCGTKIDKSDIRQGNHLNSSPDSIEKEKARKELKRIVGGGIFSNKTFRNELIKNGLDIIATSNAIRKQVEREIDSGQIKSAGVEFRVNQLILEYKTKKENRLAREKQEEEKKLKTIDEIFESEEIKSQIRKNGIGQIDIIPIRASLKHKLIDKHENMSEEEIRRFIKASLEKVSKKPENTIEMGNTQRSRGGYCSLNCRYCYEEFFDGDGAIVGDFTGDGYTEYYCKLGHPISHGRFCEDYE